MTEEERALLPTWREPSFELGCAWAMLVIVPVVSMLLGMFIGPMFAPSPSAALWLAFGLAALALAVWFVRERRRHYARIARAREAHERMLATGQIQVIECRSGRCVRIEEFEDEGIAFVFDVGARKLLYLREQAFGYRREEFPGFPNDHFEVITTPEGTLLRIVCRGSAIAPERVIPGEAMTAEFDDWPAPNTVIDGDLDEVPALFSTPRRA